MFLFTGVKFIPETRYNIDIETNPLGETIKICIDELFKSEIAVLGFNKKEMFEMLLLTLKESTFCLITNIIKLTELL